MVAATDENVLKLITDTKDSALHTTNQNMKYEIHELL